MRLRKIAIQNFRGLNKIELDLDDTTVLIGENNTGKTSILDAIRIGLGRTYSRKSATFEDYDYHLSDKDAQPGQAGPLSITFWFIESKPDEWSDPIVQALGDDVIVFIGDVKAVIFRINSAYDEVTKNFVTDWDFLNADEKPLSPKTRRPQVLSALQQFCPVFYLAATRDASKDFGSKSPFWAPFLRNPKIDPKVRIKLEKEIEVLNVKIINAHESLNKVKDNLGKAGTVVPLGGEVAIEALPGRAFDALSRAQVSLTGTTGATLPLGRHGSGTQSLATMFLFEAFLKEMLSDSFDPESEPILTLEEPEAHLHPSAIRTLWLSLQAMKGQKIIATHSGDFLTATPFSNIRRLYRNKKNQIEVRQISLGTLTHDEHRKLEFHVRYARGELFFALCWVLVEGETEYQILSGLSNVMGDAYNFEKNSIRIVPTRHIGIKALIKVADSLGISWHCLTDNDSQGKNDATAVRALLNGRAEANHLTVLSEDNIELYLCKNGLGDIYNSHISPQKKSHITAAKNSDEYWRQVVKAMDDTPKPAVAIEVLEYIEKKGLTAAPTELKDVIKAATKLVKR